MAANERLCTAQDVLDAWPAFGNLPATRQTSLLNTASQAILNFCRRDGFSQVDRDELHNGRNTSELFVYYRPIIAVTGISIAGDPLDNSLGDAWGFFAREGRIIRGRSVGTTRFNAWFPQGVRNIEVIYTAGYPAVPDPIVQATVLEVIYLQQLTRLTGIYTSESIGDYQYTLNTTLNSTMTLPSHVADLCANYVQDDGPL